MRDNRFLKALFCFLVICSLIINMCPMRANAVGALAGAPAASVIASIITGLGVLLQTVDLAEPLIEDCKDFLTLNYDFITEDDKIELWSTGNPDLPYMVDSAVIEAVRTWLFESETVTQTDVEVPEGQWWYNGIVAPPYPQNVDMNVYPYVIVGYSGGSLACVFTSQPLKVYQQFASYNWYYSLRAEDTVDKLSYVRDSGTEVGWTLSNETAGIAPGTEVCLFNALFANNVSTGIWANYDLYGTEEYNYSEIIVPATLPISESGTVVVPVDGLTPGYIAPQDESLEVGYPAWWNSSLLIPGLEYGGDDDVRVYPLTIAPTLEDTLTIEQEEVWAGTVSDGNAGTDEEDKVIVGDMTGHLTQIGGDLGILDGFTMPNYGDIDIEFEDILDDDDGNGISLISEFFEIIFSIEHIYIVFFIAFTLALISFAIFGKR